MNGDFLLHIGRELIETLGDIRIDAFFSMCVLSSTILDTIDCDRKHARKNWKNPSLKRMNSEHVIISF